MCVYIIYYTVYTYKKETRRIRDNSLYFAYYQFIMNVYFICILISFYLYNIIHACM